MRIEQHGASTTLVNTTGTTVETFSGDADPAPLDRYVQALRRAVVSGGALDDGTANLTGATRTTQVHVVVPLRIEGSVGGRHISAVVTNELTVPARGKLDLTVEPEAPRAPRLAGRSGRAALAAATRFVLAVARLGQYERFLANPDPAGGSTTTYAYRTKTPPRIATAIQPRSRGRDWTKTIAIGAVLLLAALGGLALWTKA